MNVCIEEKMGSENRRAVEGGDVERAVVDVREIFRGLGAATALLAFRGTRSISADQRRDRTSRTNATKTGSFWFGGIFGGYLWQTSTYWLL